MHMNESLEGCLSTSDKYIYIHFQVEFSALQSCSPNALGVPIKYYLWLPFPFGNNEGMVVPILAHKDSFVSRQSGQSLCPSSPVENQVNFSPPSPPLLPLFLFYSCSYAILKYLLIYESFLGFKCR